jgi:hypothetical protein
MPTNMFGGAQEAIQNESLELYFGCSDQAKWEVNFKVISLDTLDWKGGAKLPETLYIG